MWLGGLLAGAAVLGWVTANYPLFDPNTKMQPLYLPSDVRVGTVIYRLRATDSDKDYPLHFSATDYGSYVVRIEDLPCSKKNSLCEANVFLERSVTPDQVFKFRLTVKDTKGDTTTSTAVIEVTHGETNFEQIFPHVPGVIMIPEDTKVGAEIEYVIVRKNPRHGRPAFLELWGATEFEIKQTFKKDTTTGIIVLTQSLDYEVKTMFNLSVYATGMYIDSLFDTRNIAGFDLVVVVSDVQDTPPVWDPIAPITYLTSNLTVGDVVLKVTARDGDKGIPREIKYGLVSEGNPFTVFFSVDQVSGEIRLVRPLKDLALISRPDQPIILTVMAEEVAPKGELGDTSTANVALLLIQTKKDPPFFGSQSYVTKVLENSSQGTRLTFDKKFITEVNVKLGVFSLSLENNNGTFEISPSVADKNTFFTLRVRDNSLLDYEKRTQLSFKILAKELNSISTPLFSSVSVVVNIIDVNDNPPFFSSSDYSTEIAENVTAGYKVIKVEATDVDTGDGGIVRYTNIFGRRNSSLNLDPVSGIITIATNSHGFDREEASEYKFQVEARDDNGRGNSASAVLTLHILDVNDNAPRFLKSPMDFILSPDGLNFTQRAFVTAVDDDAEPPNNIIKYEILSGNYGNRFILDGETGELMVNRGARITRQTLNVITKLVIRAYDLGIPTLSSTAEVRIFPAESSSRLMRFVLPGKNLDIPTAEKMISQVTGAKVIIHNIQPYSGQSSDETTDLSGSNREKSIVTATVVYNNNAIVDLDTLQQNLVRNKSIVATHGIVGEEMIVERSETKVLFWILLLILLLFLLALATLICCCLCRCCPYYAFFSSMIRRKSAVREVAIVEKKEAEKENKSVQAVWNNGTLNREAWSADDRRIWAAREGSGRRLFILQERGRRTQAHHQPNLIYSKHFQQGPQLEKVADKPNQPEILVLEDIDRGEYQVLDPMRLAPAREPLFIREGNAEILRMVTREGRREAVSEEPLLNQPQRPFTLENKETEGKASLMKRFINDTKEHHNESRRDDEKELEEKEEVIKKVMDMDRDLSTADMNRLTAIQRDLLLTRFLVEEQRRTRFEDTQSLPGVVTMGTQTDRHVETQTDKSYFKRKSKSDIEDNDSDTEENGRKGLFKRIVKNRMREEKVIDAFRSFSRPEFKSPILEEGEDTKPQMVSQTKASLKRQACIREKFPSDEEESSRVKSKSELDLPSALRRREKLHSLQVTPVKQLNITNNVLIEHVRHQESRPESKLSMDGDVKNDIDAVGAVSDSLSHSVNLNNVQYQRSFSQEPSQKTESRYMEWYKTKKEMRDKKKRDENKPLVKDQKKTTTKKNTSKNTTVKKTFEVNLARKTKKVVIDETPIIKSGKSEELLFQKDEGIDSDIAIPYLIGPPSSLKHGSALEKKSIFTIAYDDVGVKKLRIDSASPP